MIGVKSEIENFLVFQPEDKLFFIDEIETKEQRSKAQNNTFYMCFKRIGDKMGISVEEVKMNCLKALFGVSTSKFGGVTYENALKPKTSELTKEEAILLIDTLVEFGKKLGLGEIVTSRERQSLFYNN